MQIICFRHLKSFRDFHIILLLIITCVIGCNKSIKCISSFDILSAKFLITNIYIYGSHEQYIRLTRCMTMSIYCARVNSLKVLFVFVKGEKQQKEFENLVNV